MKTRAMIFILGSFFVCAGCGEDGSESGTPSAPTSTTVITYAASLSPANEVPAPTPSSGSGHVNATLSGTTLSLNGSYVGLTGPATAAHVHYGLSGVAGAIVCPLTVTEGSIAGAGTVTGSCEVSVTDLDAQLLYVNVHTAANPAGEIRGQLVRDASTPTPITYR